MKNLNNKLFAKFEPNKIDDLAKVVGGAPQGTTWTMNTGISTIGGPDTVDYDTDNSYVATYKDENGEIKKRTCDFCYWQEAAVCKPVSISQ